mgnify:CR=1 FL=1
MNQRLVAWILVISFISSPFGGLGYAADSKVESNLRSTCNAVLALTVDIPLTSGREIIAFSKQLGKFAVSPVQTTKDFVDVAITPFGEARHSPLYYVSIVGPIVDAARDSYRRRGALIDAPLGGIPVATAGGFIAAWTIQGLHGNVPQFFEIPKDMLEKSARAFASSTTSQVARFSVYDDPTLDPDTSRLYGRLIGVVNYVAWELLKSPTMITALSTGAYVGFFWSSFSQKVVQEIVKPRVIDSQPRPAQMRAIRDERFSLDDILEGNKDWAEATAVELKTAMSERDHLRVELNDVSDKEVRKEIKNKVKELNQKISGLRMDLSVLNGGHQKIIKDQEGKLKKLETEIERIGKISELTGAQRKKAKIIYENVAKNLRTEKRKLIKMKAANEGPDLVNPQAKLVAKLQKASNRLEENLAPRKVLRKRKIDLGVARVTLKSLHKAKERIGKYFTHIRSNKGSSRAWNRVKIESYWYATNVAGQFTALFMLPLYLIGLNYLVGDQKNPGPLRDFFSSLGAAASWLWSMGGDMLEDALDRIHGDQAINDGEQSDQERSDNQALIERIEEVRLEAELAEIY